MTFTGRSVFFVDYYYMGQKDCETRVFSTKESAIKHCINFQLLPGDRFEVYEAFEETTREEFIVTSREPVYISKPRTR